MKQVITSERAVFSLFGLFAAVVFDWLTGFLASSGMQMVVGIEKWNNSLKGTGYE